jgi:hypothetical protein
MKFLIVKPSSLSIRILLGLKYSPEDPVFNIFLKYFSYIGYILHLDAF